MPDVKLSDYLAYVFSEISRARDMADRYSKEIALLYAKDDVLKFFSVPRFKLSKMDLTMPVMVTGVEVSGLMKFQMTREDFRTLVIGRLVELITLILAVKPGNTKPVRTDGLEPMIDTFHGELSALPDPSQPESLINAQWSQIVGRCLSLNGVPGELVKLPPVAEILGRAAAGLIEAIKGKLNVPKAAIEKLLVNVQTNVVKDGSNNTSVFTMKAELLEEGLIVKSVRDEKTGAESKVVEFE